LKKHGKYEKRGNIAIYLDKTLFTPPQHWSGLYLFQTFRILPHFTMETLRRNN